jgi:hypothetical protein
MNSYAPLPSSVGLLKLPAMVMIRARYETMAVKTADSVPVVYGCMGVWVYGFMSITYERNKFTSTMYC